jgi:CheY-like chemotaxis protein
VARIVLVVDDDPFVLETMNTLLEGVGFEVRTASNGDAALAALASDERIEILISDIQMPGMNGYELAEKAETMRDGLRVILLSGREKDGHGFDLIEKPFSFADLTRAMNRKAGNC